ncbi:MAG: ferredoxin reductase family protein [Candidatus Buchananbacteria bacterium]
MKKFSAYLLLILNFSAIIYIWLGHSNFLLFKAGWPGQLIAYGRLAGLLLEFFILLELLLISRLTFIEQIFGHDRLNLLHRRVGYGLFSFLILHPVLLVFGYSQVVGVNFVAQFFNFLNQWPEVFSAWLALIIFITVITVSLPIIKKIINYENWHLVHLLAYVAVALAFSHQLKSGDVSFGGALVYWLALNVLAVGGLLVYRWLKPIYLWWYHGFFVQKVVQENNEVVSVYLSGKNLDKFKFQAGQFANFIFLTKKLYSPHPFSFSQGFNGKNLRITVKILGDFTKNVLQIPLGTKVIIDGPLGLFTVPAPSAKKFLFIAGGIGITPIRALLESLTKTGADSILFYGNRQLNTLVFKEELRQFKQKNYFIISHEQIAEGIDCRRGFIDQEKIIKLAPDYLEREVYLCGPTPMMVVVVKILKKLGIAKTKIHWEKFGY